MSKSRFVSWVIWGVASLFYAYQYVLRVMPNIMLDDIMNQFNMDAATFGQFSGVYYIGYVGVMIPLGIMMDKYGPRIIMSMCIALTAIGILPLFFADHWIYAVAGRFLLGVGSAAAILGAFKIIRMSFPEERFTRMLSIAVSIGLLGAIYGGGPTAYMCNIFGYKDVVLIFASVGFILAAISFMMVPNMPKEHKSSALSDLKAVLTNGKVIAVCIFSGLMVGPLEGFADVWGTVFLKKVYGFDSATASTLPSMIFIGMCFGAPILSVIAEKTEYIKTIIGSGIVMALSFMFILTGKMDFKMIGIFFILIGVCCSYQIIAIYKASTYVSSEIAGLTTAVTNMAIMFFGYLFHTSIGSVVHVMGGVDMVDALFYGIAIIPLALTIGSVGFALMNKRN